VQEVSQNEVAVPPTGWASAATNRERRIVEFFSNPVMAKKSKNKNKPNLRGL
jgi:hypothetical protein